MLKITLKTFIILLFMDISACSSLSAPTERSEAPQVILESCYLSTPNRSWQIQARCGEINVFEDRSTQSGRVIPINLAVIPAVSRNPAPDPVFFLAGGPGEAATESFLAVYAALNKINQKRDIVLVDQRGTGGSNPLTCPVGEESDYDETDEEALKAYLQSCLSELEADPRLYTTSIAMDDLDQVREALGYNLINLYGTSYGTRAALVYARQHGEHVRSMILDGVVPLDWTLGPAVAGDAQRALDILFARCEGNPTCNAAFPDLPAEFQAVFERLKSKPESVTLKHPSSGIEVNTTLTIEGFSNTIHLMSYAPETAALIPLMIHQAYQDGDFTPIAAISLSTTELLGSQISLGMRFSVLCSEDVPFYASEQPSSGYLEGQFQESFNLICAHWPAGGIPEDYKEPVITDLPTLLLSGEADPVTPPANGERAAQTLSNSLHIIAPGQGHIVIFRGCISRIASEFIETASVSGLETGCVQNLEPMPFFLNHSGPTP